MTDAAQPSTLRQIFGPIVRVDWSQFEGAAALRCTVGVAIPLLVGLALHSPSVSAFGAVGAVSVGFGSFQGAYRSRAGVMVYAAVGMAASIFAGSLAGHSNVASIMAATVTAFASGMFIALGPAAAFVGMQSVVAVLVAGGFPTDPAGAAIRAGLVLGGGLVQTMLVVLIWPLRRFSVERRTIGSAYRNLGEYASHLPTAGGVPPEAHLFASMASPLADPQPFARVGDVLVFQAMIDEAERIRASLASVATWQLRSDDPPGRGTNLCLWIGRALFEIAAAVENGREPRESGPIWAPMETCAGHPPPAAAEEALLGQVRAAWRMAGLLTATPAGPMVRPRLAPLRRRPPVRDALATLRATLTLRSTDCRHALRLSATVAIATGIYRVLELPRGYWMPMTSLLVLRPEFHDTFTRGVARIAGTILGAVLATMIVNEIAPGPEGLTALVLAFVWACYALFRTNYTIFTICITGYVVFILMLSGVAEMTAVTLRAEYTVAGGVLAIGAYAIWPTWAASTVRASLASMLDAHRAYISGLLGAYADPAQIDLATLAATRAAARLARSNAEALIERMLAEPASRAAISPRAAVGLLAALRRHALAALALHAGVERGVPEPVRGMDALVSQLTWSLATLAAAVRSGLAPPPLPPLRQTQLGIASSADPLVGQETDLMVDSINTIAALLTAEAARGRD